MRRIFKYLIWAAVMLLIITVAGFLILPPVLQSYLTKTLSENFHRELTVGAVKINPFTLSITINGVEIKERSGSGTFMSFDELYLNFSSLSIIKRAPIVQEFKLVRPYFQITRYDDGSYNFSDLIVREEPKKEEGTAPVAFSLNNIIIKDGSIDFFDGPRKTSHTVRDINIGIPFISSMNQYVETYVEPHFRANINGNPYSLTGQTKPFAASRETTLDLDIKDLNIPYYRAYLPVKPKVKLQSASLDTSLKIIFRQEKEKSPALVLTGEVILKNIAINDLEDRPLLRVSSHENSLAAVEPLARRVHLSKLVIRSPEMTFRRFKNGDIQYVKILQGMKTAGEKPEKEEATSATSISIDELQIEQGQIHLYDQAPSDPVAIHLDKINLQCENFSTMENSKGKFSLSMVAGPRGSFALEGPFSINPYSADLAVTVKDIGVRPFQPYFTDLININVTSGDISTAGKVSLSFSEKGPKIQYTGMAAVNRFATIDKVNGDDFLKWKSLYITGLNAGYNPTHFRSSGISLSDFYSRMIVNTDGTLNLQNVLKKDGQVDVVPPGNAQKAETPPEKRKKPPIDVKIGKVTLQNGEIDFLDRNIHPGFSAKMISIGGRISGLSSTADSQADVELRGRLDNYAPLEITGKINPLRDDLLVDLKATFKDMDLSPVTPYSGKYIGRTIQKGKLSFDLKYLIAQKKLDSENKIFIDQLTLGDKVDSPQATKLPVGLAIALLKDRQGQIKLDIPVTGTLDDPQFSVWQIVIKVIVNLLTKAATAPFALLGALFGGGEELSYVDFDYGSASVPEAGTKKLDTLAKALSDRPSLKMDIEGYVDVENDREGLKRNQFMKKLKVQKLNEMIREGKPAAPVNEVMIDPQEYEKYLTLAYRAEKFPKPRNMLGMVKTLPRAEMEKLMLTNIAIKDDDLKMLSSQRARAAADGILKTGTVTPDRIFIIETTTLAPPKKEKIKDSRVDFKLK
jgi:hypothetical protein